LRALAGHAIDIPAFKREDAQWIAKNGDWLNWTAEQIAQKLKSEELSRDYPLTAFFYRDTSRATLTRDVATIKSWVERGQFFD
jgi:hypothetical protein